MDFRLLGPIEVLSGGQPLSLGGPRQRALLAYLVLRDGEVVQASRLLEELWHDPPAGGIGAVQTSVSRLRRIVGDRIATVGTGYAFRLEESDRVDLAQFRALLAGAGTADDPAERARLLRAADALWHGLPFDGLDVPFAATEALALEELRLAAVEERVEAELDAGRNGDLVAELAVLVTRHPLRERLREHWILALYRSGRQAEALEAYRETRRMFDDELGLELSPALAALERAILQHDPALDRKQAPPAAVDEPRSRRLRRAGAVAIGLAVVAAGAAAAVLVSGGDQGKEAAATVPVPSTVAKHEVPVAATTTARRAVRKHRPTHHAALVVKRPATTTVLVATAPTVPTHAARVRHTQKHTPAPVQPVTTSHRATTTTHAATPPPTPTPELLIVSDAFDGTTIDEHNWYQITDGTGWTLSQQHGDLEFSFQPGTTSDPHDGVYGGHVGTQCNFSGDFDARVDYALVQWPSSNGITVSLTAFLGPGPAVWSAQRTAIGPDEYQGYVGGKYTHVYATDWSGTLRVARAKGIITAYYLRHGSWVSLGSARNEDVASLGLQVLGGQARSVPFNGQAVVVDFDNFRVTAAGAHCPPG